MINPEYPIDRVFNMSDDRRDIIAYQSTKPENILAFNSLAGFLTRKYSGVRNLGISELSSIAPGLHAWELWSGISESDFAALLKKIRFELKCCLNETLEF